MKKLALRANIHPLPHQVVRAIAAGEVVERPAMIVKELVENALDALATRITIILEKGGLEAITVIDNGQGIPESELPLAVSRHATNKISSLADLEKLHSLGFRGEALASIGSVAQLRLVSRPADQLHAAEIVVDQGTVKPVQKVSGPVGTRVEVTELFAQLPARRKFLKTPPAELRQITLLLTALALSHPEAEFQLQDGSKLVIQTAATDQPLTRLLDLVKTETAQWLPLSTDLGLLKVTGWLGSPQLARVNPTQYWFINGRWVTQPTLTRQLKQTFGSLLEPKLQPAAVLMIEIAPQVLDVNIHPRKETVAFLDEPQVLKLLDRAVTDALADAGLIYRLPDQTSAHSSLPSRTNRRGSQLTTDHLQQLTKPWHPAQAQITHEIDQILETYLVVPIPTGLMLIDQHAAHERIIFEQLHQAWTAPEHHLNLQTLEPAPLIELSPTDAVHLETHLTTLAELGIMLEAFGEATFRLLQLPSVLSDRDPQVLLQELLDDLITGQPVGTLDSMTEKTMAYVACHSAVKAGDPLPPEQRRQLVQQLWQTPHNSTCPHGRPTMIVWEQTTLEKLFKRR